VKTAQENVKEEKKNLNGYKVSRYEAIIAKDNLYFSFAKKAKIIAPTKQ
jgi:hypothetical protein